MKPGTRVRVIPTDRAASTYPAQGVVVQTQFNAALVSFDDGQAVWLMPEMIEPVSEGGTQDADDQRT